jgi:hypothetical protein
MSTPKNKAQSTPGTICADFADFAGSAANRYIRTLRTPR